MNKLIQYKDFIADIVVKLLDVTTTGIDKLDNNKVHFYLTNSHTKKFLAKEISNKIDQYPRAHRTLIVGTCYPSENLVLKKLKAKVDPLYDHWYMAKEELLINYGILNKAIQDIFFSYFSNKNKLAKQLQEKNIRFIYLNGFSAQNLVQHIHDYLLSDISIDTVPDCFLVDNNDYYMRECNIRLNSSIDRLLQQQIF